MNVVVAWSVGRQRSWGHSLQRCNYLFHQVQELQHSHQPALWSNDIGTACGVDYGVSLGRDAADAHDEACATCSSNFMANVAVRRYVSAFGSQHTGVHMGGINHHASCTLATNCFDHAISMERQQALNPVLSINTARVHQCQLTCLHNNVSSLSQHHCLYGHRSYHSNSNARDHRGFSDMHDGQQKRVRDWAAGPTHVRKPQYSRPSQAVHQKRQPNEGLIDPAVLTALLRHCGDRAALMQLLIQHSGSPVFNHIHAAAALTAAANLHKVPTNTKLEHTGISFARQRVRLVTAEQQQQQVLGPQQAYQAVARLAASPLPAATRHHDSTHRVAPSSDLALLYHVAGRFVANMGPREIANAAWALGTLREVPPAIMRSVFERAQSQVSLFIPQALSNIAWALASLGHQDWTLMGSLLEEAVKKLPGFTHQGLANIIYALAKLASIQGSMDTSDSRVTSMAEAPTQDSLQAEFSDFLKAWLRHTRSRLSEFDPQGLANIAWAMGALEVQNPEFTPALLKAALPKMDNFTMQGLTNMVWGLARLQHYDEAAVSKILAHVIRGLPSCKTAQTMSSLAHAVATLRHYDPGFNRALVVHLHHGIQDMHASPQATANILWALAVLNCDDRQATDVLLKEAIGKLDAFKPQELSNLMWALAVLQHDVAASRDLLLAAAHKTLPHMTTEGRRQVFQYLLAMEAAGHIGEQYSDDRQYQQLRSSCLEAWRGVKQPVASRTHIDVLRAVRFLPGCQGARSEHRTEDGIFSIDIALELPHGVKVALEVDGPTHSMANAPDVMDGGTVLRNRLLQARGWHVVSLPTASWHGLAEGRQHQYLLQLLGEAGVELPMYQGSAKL